MYQLLQRSFVQSAFEALQVSVLKPGWDSGYEESHFQLQLIHCSILLKQCLNPSSEYSWVLTCRPDSVTCQADRSADQTEGQSRLASIEQTSYGFLRESHNFDLEASHMKVTVLTLRPYVSHVFSPRLSRYSWTSHNACFWDQIFICSVGSMHCGLHLEIFQMAKQIMHCERFEHATLDCTKPLLYRCNLLSGFNVMLPTSIRDRT
jgi:hypothetical protein